MLRSIGPLVIFNSMALSKSKHLDFGNLDLI
jgi:hypothetical protein